MLIRRPGSPHRGAHAADGASPVPARSFPLLERNRVLAGTDGADDSRPSEAQAALSEVDDYGARSFACNQDPQIRRHALSGSLGRPIATNNPVFAPFYLRHVLQSPRSAFTGSPTRRRPGRMHRLRSPRSWTTRSRDATRPVVSTSMTAKPPGGTDQAGGAAGAVVCNGRVCGSTRCRRRTASNIPTTRLALLGERILLPAAGGGPIDYPRRPAEPGEHRYRYDSHIR